MNFKNVFVLISIKSLKFKLKKDRGDKDYTFIRGILLSK